MRSRLTILGVGAVFLVFGAFAATYAFDPPENGSKKTKDQETAKESKSQSKAESSKEASKSKKSSALSQSKKMIDPFNKLSREEEYVILGKGTEPQNRGYTNTKIEGTYICKRCNAPLYNSTDKFESHCGWPSFDDEIKGAVKRQIDKDGYRIEIVCKNCDGHLGHVFEGERYTNKNTRHCVNSISMRLIPKGKELPKVIRPGAVEEDEKETEVPAKKAGKESAEQKPTE